MALFTEGFDVEDYDRSYPDHKLFLRILSYLRPVWRKMLVVAIAIVLTALLMVALPILISKGIETQTSGAMLAMNGLVLGLGILLAGVLMWIFNFLREIYTAQLVGDVALNLANDALDAALNLDLSFYDEHSSGRVVSRVISDSQLFSSVVTLTLDLFSQFLLFVLIFLAMVAMNARLSLLALALAVAFVLLTLSFRHVARRTTQQARRALASLNAIVQESIRGISTAKDFRQEAAIYEEFSQVNRRTYRVNFRQEMVFGSIWPLLWLITDLATTAVVYFGGLGVFRGALSAGEWFFFVYSVQIFWQPVTSMASFWSHFQQGLAASERVFALLDAPPRVCQTRSDPVLPLAGQIEFRGVSFRYNRQQQVLSDFNLTIEPGQTIALVGHTGAGKSSVGRLITRFYDFQAGEILIDGRDIRSFDLASYRRQLGIVPQNPALFSGTVADTIRYARPDVTDAEVMAVAQQLAGGDWLSALPNSLETRVGEGGEGLSLGQRQLVALARILLQDAAIILLDEATASIDPLTEAQIQEGLERVFRGRTAIVIAHRLSTIRRADRIIVLHAGQVVEEGDHQQLICKGGYYADLYQTYFRHQEPGYQPGIRCSTLRHVQFGEAA